MSGGPCLLVRSNVLDSLIPSAKPEAMTVFDYLVLNSGGLRSIRHVRFVDFTRESGAGRGSKRRGPKRNVGGDPPDIRIFDCGGTKRYAMIPESPVFLEHPEDEYYEDQPEKEG